MAGTRPAGRPGGPQIDALLARIADNADRQLLQLEAQTELLRQAPPGGGLGPAGGGPTAFRLGPAAAPPPVLYPATQNVPLVGPPAAKADPAAEAHKKLAGALTLAIDPTKLLAAGVEKLGPYGAVASLALAKVGQSARTLAVVGAAADGVFAAFAASVLHFTALAQPLAVEQFARAWRDLGRVIGEPLLPLVYAATDGIRYVADSLNALPPGAKKVLVVVAAVGAGLAGVAGVALGLMTAVGGVVAAGSAIAAVGPILIPVAAGLAAVTAAVVGFGTALGALLLGTDQGRLLLNDLWQTAKQLWGALRDGFDSAWSAAGPVLALLKTELNRSLASVRVFAQEAGRLLTYLAGEGGTAFGKILSLAVQFFTLTVQGLNESIVLAVGFGAAIKASLDALGEATKAAAAGSLLSPAVGAVAGAAVLARQAGRIGDEAAAAMAEFRRRRDTLMLQKPPEAPGSVRAENVRFQDPESFWRQIQESAVKNSREQERDEREARQAADIAQIADAFRPFADSMRGVTDALGRLVGNTAPDPNPPALAGRGG